MPHLRDKINILEHVHQGICYQPKFVTCTLTPPGDFLWNLLCTELPFFFFFHNERDNIFPYNIKGTVSAYSRQEVAKNNSLNTL